MLTKKQIEVFADIASEDDPKFARSYYAVAQKNIAIEWMARDAAGPGHSLAAALRHRK